MSDKQHVVPKLYLRRFSANGKQLNVYNLKRNRAIAGASLRDQCYGRDIYGPGPEIEKDLLNRLETEFARVTAQIIKTNALPDNMADHVELLRFLASQHVRPQGAIDQVNAELDLLMKHIVKKTTDRFSDEDLARVRVRLRHPGIFLLGALPKCVRGMLDLGMILVTPPASREFVTSDRPLILYNTYAEIPPTGRMAGNGVASIGAQFFLPLSPRLLLALYDGKVYVTRQQGELHTATERDVDVINVLQAVFASENLYYLTEGVTSLLDLSRRARPFRAMRKVQLRTFSEAPETREEGGTYSDLVFWQTTMPNLHLSLDLMRVRKAAARVPNEERHGIRDVPLDSADAEAERRANHTADRLVGKRFASTGVETRGLVDE